MKNANLWLTVALAVYFLGSLLFIFAVKKSSLSLAVATAPLAVAIIGLLFGYFYFGERMTNFQYFGVALGITALTFLLFPFQILSKGILCLISKPLRGIPNSSPAVTDFALAAA
ncbi:hypothetical protein K9N08_02750 [Candidatus Gracilibacteria bacterium]|nr:hypothetical protein [Candidatus Gracilibacteria bacterium]MCF7856452.1 hypothetical protein [Candidatus Gracilibacteria bacterium]MCF7896553.1 hypothetical protein [Candidatus Gracilibacteria bacterium]